MAKLFSPDSTIVHSLSRITDLMLLNILFLVTSIPLFTIGASVAALYSACFRIGTDREEGITSMYFHAFRENFKQGTLLWLLFVFLIGDLALTVYLASAQTGAAHYISIAALFVLVWIVVFYGYVFPLISQFDNTLFRTLKNAVILSVGYLPRSLCIAVLNAIPFIIFLANPMSFLALGSIWLLLYFSCAAMAGSRLLRKVFQRFLPQDDDETTEEES